jgi:hypothetical protein
MFYLSGRDKSNHFGCGVAERKGFNYRTMGLLTITVLYKIFLSVFIFFPNVVLNVRHPCHVLHHLHVLHPCHVLHLCRVLHLFRPSLLPSRPSILR